jgi:hypothetical protein
MVGCTGTCCVVSTASFWVASTDTVVLTDAVGAGSTGTVWRVSTVTRWAGSTGSAVRTGAVWLGSAAIVWVGSIIGVGVFPRVNVIRRSTAEQLEHCHV